MRPEWEALHLQRSSTVSDLLFDIILIQDSLLDNCHLIFQTQVCKCYITLRPPQFLREISVGEQKTNQQQSNWETASVLISMEIGTLTNPTMAAQVSTLQTNIYSDI